MTQITENVRSPIRIVIKFYMLYFLLLIFILYEMELQSLFPFLRFLGSIHFDRDILYYIFLLNQYFAVYLAIIFKIPDVKNVTYRL